MTDQHALWNTLQSNDQHQGDPSSFAQEVLSVISPSSKILELGCGAGNDAVGFAQAGHTVLATDFSDVAVGKNEGFHTTPQLSFQVVDTSQPLPFDECSFDVVYARLSLHYFPDQVTRKVFEEIHRVLKPNGWLCFICKSVNDPLYGQGQLIEPDMFELRGHVRHFFSEEYARSVVADLFTVEKMESGNEVFFSMNSAYVKVFARASK